MKALCQIQPSDSICRQQARYSLLIANGVQTLYGSAIFSMDFRALDEVTHKSSYLLPRKDKVLYDSGKE